MKPISCVDVLLAVVEQKALLPCDTESILHTPHVLVLVIRVRGVLVCRYRLLPGIWVEPDHEDSGGVFLTEVLIDKRPDQLVACYFEFPIDPRKLVVLRVSEPNSAHLINRSLPNI